MKLALPRISKSDVLEYDGEHLRFEREWEDGTLLMTRLASDRPFLIDGEVPTAKWLLQEFGKRLTIVPDRVTAVHDWANHEQDECSSRYREARRVQFVLTELDILRAGLDGTPTDEGRSGFVLATRDPEHGLSFWNNETGFGRLAEATVFSEAEAAAFDKPIAQDEPEWLAWAR